MSDFGTLAANLKKISPNQILKEILSGSDVQRWVLNTIENRVKGTGIVSDGKELFTDESSGGDHYSEFTMSIGKKSQYDHVDLFQTGGFWDSLRFILYDDKFETIANFRKGKKHISDNFLLSYSKSDFINVVTGLTNIELKKLTEQKIYPEFIKKFNNLI